MEPGPGFPVYSILAPKVLTKEQAIRAVVERLVADRLLAAALAEPVAEKILKREVLGSPGNHQGVAIPHTIHDRVQTMTGALTRFPGGVDYFSFDRPLVHTIFLLVSPVDRRDDHLRMLEKAARYFRKHFSSS